MSTLDTVHISYDKTYRVGGVTFIWHDWCGPLIVNRHTERERQFKNISQRNWAMIGKFCSMSDEQRAVHKIY